MIKTKESLLPFLIIQGFIYVRMRIVFTIFIILLKGSCMVKSTTFTFVNKCDHTVWPGILGKPALDTTGFQLSKGESKSLQAPPGWSGRFWGRTGCQFDDSGHGSCSTADCGSGQVECNGNGANPPATLAEFTLGSGSPDFYDVSLVDGYNLPLLIEGSTGSGNCASTGCVADLNRKCPSELKSEGGGGCRSACEAFGNPEYCCSGAFNSPAACKPSMYSTIFKSACPRSYSYAYDDATSTFTCSGSGYTITFCPNFHGLKTLETESMQAASTASSWLANLATGEASSRTQPSSFMVQIATVLVIFMVLFLKTL